MPEFFNQKTASKVGLEDLWSAEKCNFYVKHRGNREYAKTKGYLADIGKVKSYFRAEFERMNLDIDRELIEESIHEYQLDDIVPNPLGKAS